MLNPWVVSWLLNYLQSVPDIHTPTTGFCDLTEVVKWDAKLAYLKGNKQKNTTLHPGLDLQFLFFEISTLTSLFSARGNSLVSTYNATSYNT